MEYFIFSAVLCSVCKFPQVIRTQTELLLNGADMTRKAVLALLITLFVGVSAVSVNVHIAKASAVRNFTLYGDFSAGWGFTASNITSPGPTISVEQGDVVNLTLISHDGALHQFLVDYNGNEAHDSGEPESPQFSTSPIQYSFNASVNGTFTYWCPIHLGKMHGPFIVNPVIPEFPSTSILMLFMLATLIAVVVYKRKYR
jgi:hypothetical protein